MKLKAVLFDLDGTLLPLDEEEFIKIYFGLLCKRFVPLGYDKDELVAGIWQGTKLMMQNDGSKTNEQVFWDYFYAKFGEDKKAHFHLFDDFYNTDFLMAKSCCKDNPHAREIMDFLKSNEVLAVLASRPVFPHNGMVNRAGFVGLKEEDFAFITDYSVCSYSKPNPKYYQEILDKLGLKADEVLMFGNNEEEDGCAQDIGIKTYMVGDYLIRGKKDRGLTHLSLDQIIPTIQKHLK